MDALSAFTPDTRAWFERSFAAPTPAQEKGWPAIASGKHVLIQAPTGSGKTLAAFLYAIDRLTAEPGGGLRVLYVSPLKALNYDVERNLRGPLAGLRSQLRVAVRTGDTPQKERRAMLRDAPDILITTPESLFLLLTSQARELCAVGRDGDRRRGARGRGDEARRAPRALARAAGAARDGPFQRIGLSATQRPLEEIGRFVAGGRPIELVDAGVAKALDLEIVVPVEDMRELDRLPTRDARPGRLEHNSVDLAVDLSGAARARARAPLDDRLRQQPPPRRAARAAAERARGRGDRARPPRLARARAARA